MYNWSTKAQPQYLPTLSCGTYAGSPTPEAHAGAVIHNLLPYKWLHKVQERAASNTPAENPAGCLTADQARSEL